MSCNNRDSRPQNDNETSFGMDDTDVTNNQSSEEEEKDFSPDAYLSDKLHTATFEELLKIIWEEWNPTQDILFAGYFQIVLFLLSFGDVVSDYYLSGEYFYRNNTYSKTSSDPDTTNPFEECVRVDHNPDTNMITFNCWGRDYYYGGLTLLFIYLPSSYTVAAVLGPVTSGWCSIRWGIVMIIVGPFVAPVVGVIVCEICPYIGQGMSISLGCGILFVGIILLAQQWRISKPKLTYHIISPIRKFLLYPFLLIFSPLIFLYIKFLTIIKRDNKMIDSQKKIASIGEAILEASPQYCFQMYVVLHTLDPTWSQWLSIFTSLVGVNIPNIEKYHEPHGLVDLIKKCFKSKTASINFLLPTLVMFLNTVGKILSISIIIVFFQFYQGLFIIIGYCVASILLLSIISFLYSLHKEKDKGQQLFEAMFLGFLTQTNLSDTRTAKIVRMVVFYTSLIFYCGIVMNIMYIFNVNPNNNIVLSGIPGIFGDIIWKDLALVQHITILNTVCGVTLSCFGFSWILDIVCQCVTDRGGVYHAACCCTSETSD